MPRIVKRILVWAALGATFVVFIFPLYYLVATSLKTKAELFQAVPTLYPHQPTLEPYFSVLITRGFLGLLINSVIVGASATAIAVAVAFAISYPITRLPVQRGMRNFVLNWALSLRFLPPIAVVIPYFTIVRTIGLYNQIPALVLVYTIFNLPLSIWMLKGFLEQIPAEVEVALVGPRKSATMSAP